VKVGDTGGTGVACCVELKNVKLIYMCVGKERGEVCTCGRRLFSIRYPICERYLVIKSTASRGDSRSTV
jgi:hypothetical protein